MSGHHVTHNGNEDQPSLDEETVDRPRKMQLLLSCGGATQAFEKSTAVKCIAEFENDKDLNEDKSFSTVLEETEKKLVDIFKEIPDSLEANDSVKLFHDWLLNYIGSDRFPYNQMTQHFISFMLDSYLDKVNQSFEGLTTAQENVVRVLVEKNNKEGDRCNNGGLVLDLCTYN